MRLLQLLALLLATLSVACAARGSRSAFREPRNSFDDAGVNWAVLIAGSNGWGNYRHQSDVAHAYQVLKAGGLKEEHIIVFMFDDVARHPLNPFPNKLFNQPGGPDVYEGVKVDYSGASVTASNFLAVLSGNASAIQEGPTANGRVLESGPNDHVFVYYSDHGAPGIVGMPSGPFLFADQWVRVLKERSGIGYEHMVIYLEACESGSMFQGLLPPNISVFATTAANARESSWGTYCPGMHPAPPVQLMTCLGDLYSVAWMEDADESNLTLETLKKQFEIVRRRTSQNFTYIQGSHVQEFGAIKEMSEQAVGEYLGPGSDAPIYVRGYSNNRYFTWRQGALPQREADLAPLYAAVAASAGNNNEQEHARALRGLGAELARRARVDAEVFAAVELLVLADQKNALSFSAEAIYSGTLPGRKEGSPLVDDWDCLRGMVAAWENPCGSLDQYSMRHSRAFANLCNAGIAPAQLESAARAVCAEPGLSDA